MSEKPPARLRATTRRVRLTWIAPAALSLIVLCALLLLWAGQPRRFQEIATPVCLVPEWRNQIIYPSFGNYFWLSNTELLIRSTDDSQPPVYYRQRLSTASQPLSRRLCLPLAKQQEGILGISPDGKWAAVSGTDKMDKTITIIALDGSHQKIWKYRDFGLQTISFWMPDSQRFVIVGTPDGSKPGTPSIARIYSVDRDRPQSVSVPALKNLTGNNTGFVGFTSSGKAVFQLNNPWFQSGRLGGGGPMNYPNVPLVEIDLNQQVRGAPPRFFSLHVPRGMDFGMLFLSPKGDRIFWGGFALADPPPWNKWLNHWIPAVKAEQRLIETGWISDADGSHSHQLGYYEIPGDLNQPNPPGSKGPAWVLEPRWSPDGKRISFLHDDSIYTVPAN